MKNNIKTGKKNIFSGLAVSILLIAILTVPVSAKSFEKQKEIADFTEGGHLETDFNVNFMAEWWYLNGKARLVASDGEKKNIGFFVTLAHQESPLINDNGNQLSHLLTFYGIYPDDSRTTFNYIETYIPRTNVSDYIALHTPYVDYTYPDGLKRFHGSSLPGYNLNYTFDDMKMDLFFQTNINKTIDQSDAPLNFTTYEHSGGTIHGSITLDGKKYTVTQADGYMDHMIPVGYYPWPMYMHGWTWFEVTTKNYQAVAYAVRSVDDGYDNYSYKHLTLLNKENGKVVAEYSADKIKIIETNWIDESEFNRKRPEVVEFQTPDLNVTVNATSLVYFNASNSPRGFVDFMAFQPDDAIIQYNGNIQKGSSFYEYLVSD
jgi:hypothetical protein